jgi:coenzyme F420-0:L-glutamate ligase/coenzyme F420-1:gamma-L-glutamate ligase
LAKGTHQYSMILAPLSLRTVKPGDRLTAFVIEALERQRFTLQKSDVLAVASKLASICECRIAKLDEVEVSARARHHAERWKMNERLAQLVLEEADAVLGGVKGFLLTLKNGVLTANAGVDLKNSLSGTATLWPKNPDRSARELRRNLEARYRKRLGVLIVDSRITALRLGTIGLAIGASGFLPVKDNRGKPDLYGRRVRVTQTNIIDDLASSAHLLMGETNERTGVVIIRNAPVRLDEKATSRQARLSRRRCLISSNLKSARINRS